MYSTLCRSLCKKKTACISQHKIDTRVSKDKVLQSSLATQAQLLMHDNQDCKY